MNHIQSLILVVLVGVAGFLAGCKAKTPEVKEPAGGASKVPAQTERVAAGKAGEPAPVEVEVRRLTAPGEAQDTPAAKPVAAESQGEPSREAGVGLPPAGAVDVVAEEDAGDEGPTQGQVTGTGSETATAVGAEPPASAGGGCGGCGGCGGDKGSCGGAAASTEGGASTGATPADGEEGGEFIDGGEQGPPEGAAAADDKRFGEPMKLDAIMLMSDVIAQPEHYSQFEEIQIRGRVVAVAGDKVFLSFENDEGLHVMCARLEAAPGRTPAVGDMLFVEGKLTAARWSTDELTSAAALAGRRYQTTQQWILSGRGGKFD